MKMPITMKDILDSDGKFDERAEEATEEQKTNATDLAERVTALLRDLGVVDRPRINSGLRDAAANKACGGAARSPHLEGEAVDLADAGHVLAKRITHDLLLKHGLRMEHPSATKNWCHLDTRPPAGRVFLP